MFIVLHNTHTLDTNYTPYMDYICRRTGYNTAQPPSGRDTFHKNLRRLLSHSTRLTGRWGQSSACTCHAHTGHTIAAYLIHILLRRQPLLLSQVARPFSQMSNTCFAPLCTVCYRRERVAGSPGRRQGQGRGKGRGQS